MATFFFVPNRTVCGCAHTTTHVHWRIHTHTPGVEHTDTLAYVVLCRLRHCRGKRLPKTSVNDDYCDCEDGSDEPGTSACKNSAYVLRNKRDVNLLHVATRVCVCVV